MRVFPVVALELALELFHGLVIEGEVLYSLLCVIVVALARFDLCIYLLSQVSILQHKRVILVLEDRVLTLDSELESSRHLDN